MKVARRVGFALFGVLNGTEVGGVGERRMQNSSPEAWLSVGAFGPRRWGPYVEPAWHMLACMQVNPNFVKDASAYIDPEKGVILYCSIGGSLEPTQSSKKGLQSR